MRRLLGSPYCQLEKNKSRERKKLSVRTQKYQVNVVSYQKKKHKNLIQFQT